MNHYQETPKIIIFATSDELRRLADKLDRIKAERTVGETTFVDFLAYSEEYILALHFTQNQKP